MAVFVDAGYLYAGGAKSVSGTDGTKRPDISVNIPVAVAYLIKQAETISQQKLLRIYWYDAAPNSGRLTTDHQILASTDNVKLRLGVINGFGQQKGVDGKIITDLAELSRNRAFADAVLLGGDEDLRLGVELAQEYGTRVHLLTIEGSTFSPTLRREADTMSVLPRLELQDFITVGFSSTAGLQTNQKGFPVLQASWAPQHAAQSVAPSVKDEQEPQQQEEAVGLALHQVILRYLTELSPEEQVSLTTALRTGTGVPSEHDGKLLALSRNALDRPLTQPEKVKLRSDLKSALDV